MIETIYLSQRAKDQLIKIKRSTGIQNWNILCRWAFCLSLKDNSPPTLPEDTNDHAIEMSWKVFGGQDYDIYLALLKERCQRDKQSLNKENVTQQLRAHINRGISFLSEKKHVNNISALVQKI